MDDPDRAVSFELLGRRARRGDAFALGSIALHMLHSTRLPSGEADPRAVALVAGAAAAGCNRCSRILAIAVGMGRGWLPAESGTLERLWRLHRRNERRFEERVAAAIRERPLAAVVSLTP